MTQPTRTPSDRRVCWECHSVQFVLPGSDDIRAVDRAALRAGWRYTAPWESWRLGRMLCPDCAAVRARRARDA
jgi:hypothetical protein